VPADLVSRLFEPFANSADSGGTGLGLNLVREIARRHGGEATYLAPADGEPSTFEIRLPLGA
jgi:signal transduction histidine kinase